MAELNPRLLGRDHEITVVRDLLADVSDRGSVLVIDGEPGVGKTALAEAAITQARWRGLAVLRMSGAEAESDLPWAALHQLIHVLRDRIEDLPAPQREALQVAFGERQGAPPSVFLISLATLTLLSERTTDAGLLLVVEDLHWIDRSTRTVLEFIARRIAADPVLMLTTTRDPDGTLGTSSRLHLDALSEDDARKLLAEHAPELSEAVRGRVLGYALGNPLALIELASAARRGDVTPDADVPLSRRLEDAFARQLSALDDVERAIVLIAAVRADAPQAEVLAAAARLLGHSVPSASVDALVKLGLLRRDGGSLYFRHPLVRSAVMQTVGAEERARAHRAVATLLPPGTDRHIWHLAVTATGPDEALARQLEKGGSRAQQSGDPQAALAAYVRAAELSPHTDDQARRTYLAAEAALEARRTVESRALVQEVSRLTADRGLLARAAWLQELHPGGALQRGEPDTAIAIADETFAADHANRAIDILVTMAFHFWGRTPEGPAWTQMIGRVTRYGAAPDDPRLLLLMSFGTPGENSGIVRARLGRSAADQHRDVDRTRLLALASAMAGELTRTGELGSVAADALRRGGRLATLATFLLTLAPHLFHIGDTRRALEAADESLRLADELNEPFMGMSAYALVLVIRANLGEEVRAASLGERYPTAAFALEHNPFHTMVAVIDGIVEARSGRPERAYELLRQVVHPDSPTHHWAWGVQEAFCHFVEAAVRGGQHAEGLAAINHLAARTGLAESPLVSSELAFARAVVSEDDDAFARAISPEHNLLPYWRARAQLLYGERLRRGRRVGEARGHLRSARNAFDELGAVAWAETARAELRAAGEESPKAPPQRGSALTPQEERIAALAADGLSNRDIAERLFLSPRTVGAHLYAVYRKLEINSRADLRDALKPSPS